MKNSFSLIAFSLGVLLLIIGTAMLIPAMVDWNDNHANAAVFLHGALISWFIGGAMVLTNRGNRQPMGLRFAFLMTALAWTTTCAVCAIPLWLSDLNISYTDAFFESVSGLTTTGSTVLSGLDTMSHGILIWRSLMNGIGGIGIIAFVILLLPLLKIGGMQLFHTESSDQSDKALPRTAALMKSLLLTFFALTAACALTYYILGMSGFDAIAHALPTIATGGFSTRDTSFMNFSPALQYASCLFMLLGGLPFILFVRMMMNNEFAFHRDPQVRAVLVVLAVGTLILTLDVVRTTDLLPHDAFRHVLFNLISIITTTGFASFDYMGWSSFAVMLFFFATYLGACAGSTSGGIKMMRVVIATRALLAQIKRLVYPHGVFVITYDGRTVPPKTVYSVLGFLFVYVAANVFLTIALSLTGLDFATSISGAATAIANVGPGVGTVIGPAGNFSTLPDTAKWLIALGMLIGRLEIMTVLVLFTPAFWRK
jgi:trk system potassium uptake protein TrkH